MASGDVCLMQANDGILFLLLDKCLSSYIRGSLSHNLDSPMDFFFFKSHECVISSAVSLGKERVPHFEALYISELKAEARQFTLEFPNILKLRHGGYLMGVTQGRGFGENGDSLDALKLQCL